MFHMSEICFQYVSPVFTLVRKGTCVQSCSIHKFSRSWPSCQTMSSTNVCFFMCCPSFSWRKLSWCPPSLAQGMQAGSFRSLAQRLALPSYGLSWPRGLPRSQWPSSLKAWQWGMKVGETWGFDPQKKYISWVKPYNKKNIPQSSPFL